jgi:RNA polymerase sigma-70 factor (ECF subfamily)
MSNPLQEKLLLYRVRVKKDPEAFGKIYDLYAHKIHRFIYFKVSSVEEAQDLTADVFLKAWSYLLDEGGKVVRHLGALLYGIARYRVIDHYRSKSGRETLPLLEEAEETIADDRTTQRKSEAKIDVSMLEKHLRSLKDEYREVLVMKYLDELETFEISRILGKTQGNVRVLLHRALDAIRDLVAAETPNDHERLDREATESAEG